jgi:GNAT superfamily N-acetyltransferase
MTVDFKPSRTGFTVRSAEAADAKVLRVLLPELREGIAYFVAIDRQHHLVVAAAGMTASCRTEPLTGPGISIEVIEPWRKQGVAAALLRDLERCAIQLFDSKALYAAQRVERGSDRASHWAWLGFAPIVSVEEHDLPTAGFEAELGPLFDRMRAKGRIPAGASIIPLYQANAAAVLQLHLDHMGGERGEVYRKLRGKGAGAFHPRYSRVLLIDGKVKGCILAHRAAADVAMVDANILDPTVRGGWANVWLKLEATRGALSLGIKTFRFTTFDHYSDTRSFTERLGGVTTRVTQLMCRPISRE